MKELQLEMREEPKEMDNVNLSVLRLMKIRNLHTTTYCLWWFYKFSVRISSYWKGKKMVIL